MKNSIIIAPDQLEAGATIPQALDNQYVSDKIYNEIIKQRKSLIDPIIKKKRNIEATNEFIRSLVYSPQVVINRAFIFNNELLYRYYLPNNQKSALAFASLMNSGVIVPYLYKEHNFFDDGLFDITEEGGRSAEYLSQFLNKNIKSVRLAKNDNKNKIAIEQLSLEFRGYFPSITVLTDRQRTEMLGELLGGNKIVTKKYQQDFGDYLDNLSTFVTKTFRQKGFLNRNELYKEFIVAPNTNVADGVYLAPDTQNPFRHEIKKLIDLKYNTNLPDALGRYSFTPKDMPTRSALQDDFQISDIDSSKVESFIDKDLLKLTKDKRNFMANTQRAMYLPLLSDLSLSDVLEIRNLESWQKFISKQSQILSNPLSMGDKYEDFQLAFETFQTDFSNWYYKKYGKSKVENKYFSIVSIFLNFGGKIISYGVEGLGVIEKTVLGELPKLIEGIIGGVTVKLMMNVYNAETKKLDKNRSYSIEVMRSELELTKDEMYGIINSTKGKQIPLSESLIAEQDRN